jgi:hypothetical protein
MLNRFAVILSHSLVILSGAKNLRGSFAQDKLREGSRKFVGGVLARKNNCRDSSPAKSGGLRMTDSN